MYGNQQRGTYQVSQHHIKLVKTQGGPVPGQQQGHAKSAASLPSANLTFEQLGGGPTSCTITVRGAHSGIAQTSVRIAPSTSKHQQSETYNISYRLTPPTWRPHA
jgi:hypothetical protein